MHQIADAAGLGYGMHIGGSTYVGDDDYAKELKQAVPEIDDLRTWVTGLGVTYNHWQARPWPLGNDLHPTTWVVNKARQLLLKAAADQPLFLTASFYAPHPPLFPPKEYFDDCLGRQLPPAAHGDWVAWDSLTPKGDEGGHRVLLQGETLRRAQAGYFGLIEHLDREIAPLVADFRARSEAAGRPWLVVLATDHGEMLGDHGYFRKCEPFEGSANIPLIICGSADLGFSRGRRCLEPVCLEDLLPTLAELAGARCPDVDGVSLVRVLRGEVGEIRPWLCFEHAPCYSNEQAFHALTDGHLKYIWRPYDGKEHLFDLDNDPREEHDLAADPSRQDSLVQWRSRLARWLAPRPEGFSDGKRLIAGRPYPPIQPGMPRAAPPAGDASP
jgi:arylsulfatase A-like enzyme